MHAVYLQNITSHFSHEFPFRLILFVFVVFLSFRLSPRT